MNERSLRLARTTTSESETKVCRSRPKKSKKNKKKQDKTMKKQRERIESRNTETIATVESLISPILSRDNIDDSTTKSSLLASIPSTRSVGSDEFFESKSPKIRKIGCILDEVDFEEEEEEIIGDEFVWEHRDFRAAFGPNDMRCLALVSHPGTESESESESSLKQFIEVHKHVLKKFRLTGTAGTMSVLRRVFAGDPEVVFGSTIACSEGGNCNADLVALMATGKLGGILFFQDPINANPHPHAQKDIRCLTRQAKVHNTVIATTPTTAMAKIQVFRMALKGEGMAELIPSFL